GAAPAFAQPVSRYDLAPAAAGGALALLSHRAADKGLALRFRHAELPCFTVWKNTGALEDGHVTGLEPATNFPNFKSFERQQGRVRLLPPGGKWEATWSTEVLDTAAGVADVLKEIVSMQAKVRPTIHRGLQPGFSPV